MAYVRNNVLVIQKVVNGRKTSTKMPQKIK